MAFSIVILAAGQGKRMCSDLPKVLHNLGGRTLLEHVSHTAGKLAPKQPPLVIYGHKGAILRQQLANLNVTWVEQLEQLGTGHALLQALPQVPLDNQVLILSGDVPLITSETLQRFLTKTPADAIGIMTAHLPQPAGLGRILRDAENKIYQIVEEKDASASERSLKEINAGIYLVPALYLQKWLPLLKNQNAQQEYYITDIIHLAVSEKIPIHSHEPAYHEEILGINDRVQLAQLERFYQRTQAEKLMRQGVTLYDPSRFDLRGELLVGHDVIIDINVVIEGRVTIGNHCVIGPNTFLRNVTLADHVEIRSHCHIDGAEIAGHSIIGPYARIRPGTQIAEHAEVGNFIEIKNSFIGPGTKIHHVGYIGDSTLGKQVNIGAGTITCNYDGANKHKTFIGDHAFIGSNASLVAPVTIGEGAFIGAGSTITHSAPAHQLTVCRVPQRTVENWQKKQKKEMEV